MFEIKQNENVVIVIPEFNFDIENLENVRNLRDELERFISGIENPVVLVNFENVSYIDSTGLGNIIRMFEMVRKRRGKFTVCNLNVDVEKIFKITTLDSVIEIYPTENDALNNLKEE